MKFDARSLAIIGLLILAFAVGARAEYIYPPNGIAHQTNVVDSTGANVQSVDATGAAKITGTITSTPSGIQDSNIKQINGTTADANNGATSAGTIRVTVSNDSTGQMKLSTGANTIGQLTANQSVNTAQVSGTTTDTNNGATSAGTQRVTISNDSTGVVKLATGANTIGQLTANQSINAAQIAGTATDVNNGATSAGTIRVTMSNDSTGQVKLATGTNTVGSVKLTDGTNTASVSSAGAQSVNLTQVGGANISAAAPVNVTLNGRSTYATVINGITPAATATDVIQIGGSATKLVRVLRVILSTQQTTSGINKWFVIKRSAADTGGTLVTDTIVPLDSNNAAATGTIKHFSANATGLGASVGNVRIAGVEASAATNTIAGDAPVWDETTTGQACVLHGTAENLYINFNGAAIPTGLSLTATIITTEE